MNDQDHLPFREYILNTTAVIVMTLLVVQSIFIGRLYTIANTNKNELRLLRESSSNNLIESNKRLQSIESWIDAHVEALKQNIGNTNGYKTP